MMLFPTKMKTNVSVIVLTAVALLMSTLLFKECPFLLVAASPAPQSNGDVPTPPRPNKSSNVPTPPSHQRNVHSSNWASAGGRLFYCKPAAPQCPHNAPSPPGCCPSDSKEEQQVKANGKGELVRNYESSIDARKHGPADHINIPVVGGLFDDSRRHKSSNVPTPPRPHKSSNVPTPPSHQRNVHSSNWAWAERRLSHCKPASPQCPRNAPSPPPGCCTLDSKEEQQVKANGKAELLRNYESSIDAQTHAPADHIKIAVEGGRFDDSPAAHTQSFKSTRELIGY